jgi:nitric oxide reductase subunit B
VNYYEHGTYLTMNHAHGALFGVYGMLSLGLLLFSWRGLVRKEHWDDRLLKICFLGFNGGLLLLTLGTLFPVGIMQTWTAYQEGLWAARDAAFFERKAVLILGTLRVIPDLTIILVGVVPPPLVSHQDLPPPEGPGDRRGRIRMEASGGGTVKRTHNVL